MATIDFYFDFSSPYGYFASTQIEEIGSRHGQEVRWRPYLMGVVMKISERGVDVESLKMSITNPKVVQQLRDVNDEAIAKGVFGSPFILVGNEPFWGHDRLEHVDHWLQTGGW